MILEVFASENNEPLSEHDFNVLMKAAQEEKKQIILNQKIKSNADNSIIGIALAKYALFKVFNVNVNDLEIAYTQNGKPYPKTSPNIHLSISHSDTITVCAVSDSPVGIDVEKIRKFNNSVSEKIFGAEITHMLCKSKTPNEDFTVLWTEKEAVLKLTGEGISGIRKNINTNNYNTETLFYKNYCVTVATLKKALTAE